MKYTCSVKIDLPLDKTIDLWTNENYYHYWQDGFKSIEHLEGKPNTVGSKSRIVLKDKQKIELLETIITNNLPEEKTALYEHKHMINTQKSCFKALNSSLTLYTSEVEYIKFNGVLIKLMAKLFPNKFKSQSLKWMHQFKRFAESHN